MFCSTILKYTLQLAFIFSSIIYPNPKTHLISIRHFTLIKCGLCWEVLAVWQASVVELRLFFPTDDKNQGLFTDIMKWCWIVYLGGTCGGGQVTWHDPELWGKKGSATQLLNTPITTKEQRCVDAVRLLYPTALSLQVSLPSNSRTCLQECAAARRGGLQRHPKAAIHFKTIKHSSPIIINSLCTPLLQLGII